LFGVNFAEELWALDQFDDGRIEGFSNLLDDWVGLRVHGGPIKRIFPVMNAQETGGLLEGLAPMPVTLASSVRERNFPCWSR